MAGAADCGRKSGVNRRDPPVNGIHLSIQQDIFSGGGRAEKERPAMEGKRLGPGITVSIRLWLRHREVSEIVHLLELIREELFARNLIARFDIGPEDPPEGE